MVPGLLQGQRARKALNMLIAYKANVHFNAFWSSGLGVNVSTKGFLPSSALVFTILEILLLAFPFFYLHNLGPPVLYIHQTLAVEFNV